MKVNYYQCARFLSQMQCCVPQLNMKYSQQCITHIGSESQYKVCEADHNAYWDEMTSGGVNDASGE